MPAQPRWLARVPEILEALQAAELPVVDRAAVEQLFRVSRRRAIQLLTAFGGYQSGKTFLIQPEKLIEQLETIRQGRTFTFECRRRERLAGRIESLRKHHRGAQVRIRVGREALDRKVADLPDGIRLEPGRLTVEFASTEELLGKLFQLVQAAQNDFDRFSSAAEPTGQASTVAFLA